MDQAPKISLYHAVPKDLEGTTLHPLSVLKEKHPEIYSEKIKKYEGRVEAMEIPIPTLGHATWSDVIHLSAIHPQELKKQLIEAGMDPEKLKNMEYYQVDPRMLDPKQTTVFLHQYDPETKTELEQFVDYNPSGLEEHAVFPEATKEYYRKMFKKGEKPLFFLGVPHILHKGSIDISNLPVIKV